jgi:hypothetical protein
MCSPLSSTHQVVKARTIPMLRKLQSENESQCRQSPKPSRDPFRHVTYTIPLIAFPLAPLTSEYQSRHSTRNNHTRLSRNLHRRGAGINSRFCRRSRCAPTRRSLCQSRHTRRLACRRHSASADCDRARSRARDRRAGRTTATAGDDRAVGVGCCARGGYSGAGDDRAVGVARRCA